MYNWAVDESGNLVSIDEALVKRGEYLCLNCEGDLIIKNGDIRRAHFAHKTDICNEETYLHMLAKRKFYTHYLKCLEDNKPFNIELQQYIECDRITDPDELHCATYGPSSKSYLYDLTKYYKEVYLETKYNEFIPDILLKSKKDVIFVEIAVTHKCSKEKIASGIKIIEINIPDDRHIASVTHQPMRLGTGNSYHFSDIRKKCCNNNCSVLWFDLFVYYKSGKSRLIPELQVNEIKEFLNKHHHVIFFYDVSECSWKFGRGKKYKQFNEFYKDEALLFDAIPSFTPIFYENFAKPKTKCFV